jgi:hypothetical protein
VNLSQIRKLVVLATEARNVMLVVEESIPAEKRFDCLCLCADGTDVRLTLERSQPQSARPWVVSNGAGEKWEAGEVPDAVLHAIGEALGDKEEASGEAAA